MSRESAGEKRAKQYAMMVRKWSPAAPMRGQRLIEWRREQYRSVLDRNGLSQFFRQFEELATKTRYSDQLSASRKGDAARYRRAYGG